MPTIPDNNNTIELAGHSVHPRKDKGKLLQILGVGFGIAVAVGNSISAGIVRTPGDIAARLPNHWLFFLVWFVGALYALVSAFQLAELGAAIPGAGGNTTFLGARLVITPASLLAGAIGSPPAAQRVLSELWLGNTWATCSLHSKVRNGLRSRQCP